MNLKNLFIMIGLAALTANNAGAQNPAQPLFSFGLITDVQYADAETMGKRLVG
jgi:hypothetical protein